MRTLTSTFLFVALAVVAGAQPKYKLPDHAAFTEEEVSVTIPAIESDVGNVPAWTIAATLNLPVGDMPEGGWPAVFFISGSGSQNRHGTSAAMDLGTWEVLDAVANAGFAVVRADDRGTGGTPIGPEGVSPSEVGYNDLVSDARHCVNWLRAHEKVNKDKVFLVGHSEGGLTAPILATEGLCAGVVCMAAPGRNMYDVIYEQVKDANAGNPAATRNANLKLQKELQDAVKEGREPNYNILGKPHEATVKKLWQQQILPARKWMHEHYNLDVPAIHAAVACPVLVAQGAEDFQVKADADARQLAKNLLAGKCTDLTFKLYDDLDHLFKPCNGGKSNLKMYTRDRRVSDAYLKDVVAWLKARS